MSRSHISLILSHFKKNALSKSVRTLTHQRKTTSLMDRRRGRTPRVNLRRRNERYLPQRVLLQLLDPFLPTGKTIMMRKTSKRVKEVVDKMLLSVVVRLSRSFWDDIHNGTEKENCRFVLNQLTRMSSLYHITTLELHSCVITGPHADWLAGGVLVQCRALVHLDLI
jgi:hypothetical protein